MTKTNEDTFLYHLDNDRLTQIYRSVWFDNQNTTIVIPALLAKSLKETCYQLVCLDKTNVAQLVLGDIFHAYLDIETATIEKID